MKVILQQDVKDLGKKGAVKEVADGFARNYLIPKGFATQASEGDIQQIQEERAHMKEKSQKELSEAQQNAAALDGEEVEVFVKTNEQGELYASLPAKEITAALAKDGHKISPDQLQIEKLIKDVGEHPITVSFNDGIEAEVRVIVRSESEKEDLPAQAGEEETTKNTAL